MSGSKSNKNIGLKRKEPDYRHVTDYSNRINDVTLNNFSDNLVEFQENKSSDLFNYAPVALLVLDEDSKIMEFNETAKSFLAAEGKLLENRLLISFIHKDDKVKFYSHLNAALKNQKQNLCKVQLTNLLGESYTVLIKSDRFQIANKFYCRLAIMDYSENLNNDIVVRDTISKLNYIKDQLFKTKSFYEEILDNFPDGIFICDKDSDVIYANRYIKKKYGDVLGIKCYHTFFYSSERCHWCKGVNERNERIVFEDDTKKTLFIAHYPIKDKDGETLQLSFLKDITDNILNEKNLNERYTFIKNISSISSKLIESKRGLNSHLNSLLQFITKHVSAHCGYIYLVNEEKNQLELKNLWPYNSKRKLLKVLPEDEFPEFSTRQIRNNIFLWKDERLSTFSLNEALKGRELEGILTVPLSVENVFLGFLGFDYKTKLSGVNEMLSDELQLTAQIISNSIERRNAIDELIHAKEKAEESDRLKSVFLSNMSHEIRTPMNGILGFTEILSRMQVDRNKQKRYIDIIQQSTKQLLTIIDDIIDISKIESGQFEVFNSKVELNSFCKEIYDTHLGQLRRKNIEEISLHFTKPKELLELHCETDEVMVKRILDNLLGNAIKFTNAGSVEFGYHFLNEKTLLFFVKDTGIGINPEKQKIIFERFRQIDEGETREYGGTGLGLSITKSFVERMGGHIWIESEPNKGSTFYFTIPFKSSTDYSYLFKDSKQYEIANAWEGKKILIVDDNEDVHFYFQESFDETKASFYSAKNGKEGVEKFQELNPDIVLMDIQMPVMDGFEACSKIKDLNKNTLIIMQTAFNSKSDFVQAKKVGADEIITKPIDKERAFQKISTLLELRS